MTRALAIINNHISLSMLLTDLQERGIPRQETDVLVVREIALPRYDFASVLEYPGTPESGILAQRRFVGFYCEAARIMRQKLSDPATEHVYIVNNDNLLSSHVLETAQRNGLEVTVVAEGLMNYFDAGEHNMDAWRLRVKPVLARLLGLRYAPPVGHQSGAFHPAVSRVVSFSADGLRAPAEKIVVRRWPVDAVRRVVAEPDIGIIVHTSIARLMPKPEYRVFALGYARWIAAQGFRRLYAKRHPRSRDPMLESLLPPHEVIEDERPIEELVGELEAGVVVGPGTTPLVTLKLMRPELRCIDFGADYYVPIVYKGGAGASALFAAAGVESVPFWAVVG